MAFEEKDRFRLRILEAMLLSIEQWRPIDEVIAASADAAEAKRLLAGPPWHFDDFVVEYLLMMPRNQLTRDNVARLTAEIEELRGQAD